MLRGLFLFLIYLHTFGVPFSFANFCTFCIFATFCLKSKNAESAKVSEGEAIEGSKVANSQSARKQG
jgi:hypothetical protein